MRVNNELWLLAFQEENKAPKYVLSVDGAPGGPTYLAAFSESAAIAAAKHQNDVYDIGCFPVCAMRNGVACWEPLKSIDIPDPALEKAKARATSTD